MPGPGMKAAIDATLRMPPLRRLRLSMKASERSVSARTSRSIIASCSPRSSVSAAPEQAEARVVDDHVRLEAAPVERLSDGLRGIGAREVCRQNGRPPRALPRNGVRQRGERLFTPRDQNDVVTVGGELVGERGADPGRRA